MPPVLGAVLGAALMGGAGGPQLACRLEAVDAAPKAGGPVRVRFTVENQSRAAVRVLRWHTPLEGLRSPQAIDVSHEGRPLDYQGPALKRGDPRADDYVAVAPGGTASGEVDLALAFDVSSPGTYRARFAGPLLDVLVTGETPHARDAFRGHPLSCGPVEIRISK
jgi:uncharacterized protein (DUF58 family)